VTKTPVEVEAERLSAIEDDFRSLLTRKAADYVLEGTITSSRATVIENTSGMLPQRRWLITTRYALKGIAAWNRTQADGEFFVLGGVLPNDVPASPDYPRGQGYSFESYPSIGDHVIVALKEQPFFSAGVVPRVAEGSGILKAEGSDAIPAASIARIRSIANDAFTR
jgi:hypothetical protein